MKKKTTPFIVFLPLIAIVLGILISRITHPYSGEEAIATDESKFQNPSTTKFDTMIIQQKEIKHDDVATNQSSPQNINYIYSKTKPTISKQKTEVKKPENNRFERKYISVIPPIENVNVEKTFFTINTSIPGTITYPRSGTQISIPPNAFVDAKGNAVKGEVNIDYREFRDAADFIASGIPMSFVQDGKMNLFKSAGMFEINASQNGQEVFLKRGEKVSVHFVSTDNKSDYTFFAFNDGQNKWVPTGQANLATQAVFISPSAYLSPAVQYYISGQSKIDEKDTCSLRDRFDSKHFIYTQAFTLDKTLAIFPEEYRKQFPVEKVEGGTAVRINNLLRVREIHKIKSKKNSGIMFSIRSFNKTHPELTAFNGNKWLVLDPIPLAEFKETFGGRVSFNDIRIEQKGEKDYTIYLKDDSSTVWFDAKPVRYQSFSKKQIVDARPSMKSYNRLFARKENRFNKKLKKEILAKYHCDVRNKEEREKYFTKELNSLMNDEEKLISAESWPAYAEEQMRINRMKLADQIQKVNASNANASNFIRSLTLDGMGIFNCDQIQRVEDPIILRAQYKNSKDSPLLPETTYIVDKKMNGVLTYNNNQGYDYSPSKIVFGKNSNNTMIVCGKNGKMSIYTSEQFKQHDFTSGSSFTFGVKEVDSKITSVGDLRKLLAL